MKNAYNTHYKSHRDVSLLLPWYVNNTLEAKEKSVVESHLNICLTCRIALAEMHKLSTGVNHADPLVISANASFSRLRMRIHDNANFSLFNCIQTTWLYDCGRWLTTKRVKHAALVRPLVVFSTLLILVTLGVLQFSYKTNPVGEEYRTLSKSISTVAAKNEIRVVFSKGISNNKIARILTPIQGNVIAGPSPQGVYRIRIGIEDAAKSVDIGATLALLRSNAEVVFAEPAINAVITEKSG